MKSVIALLILLVCASVLATPAAAGVKRGNGKISSMSLSGFPDICPPGRTIEGVVYVALASDGTSTATRVDLQVIANTDFGAATVYFVRVTMMPGETRAIPVSIPVSANAKEGDCMLNFTVTTRTSMMSEDHYVRIT